MKRIVLILAACALTLISMAAVACGGDDNASTPVPTIARTATPTKTTPPSAAATSTGGSTITDATTTPSGLKYVDHVVGTGASPKRCDMVTVHYTGTFTNGTKFDSSRDRGTPYTFQIGLGQVIRGWDEGVLTMKVGGQRTLYVPSALAYGTRGNGPIPPNADLVFDVELLKVAPSSSNC